MVGKIEVWVGYGLLVAAAAAWLWPASYWFTVDRVDVVAKSPNDIRLFVEREIKHEFPGVYIVTIRQAEDDRVICTATDRLRYKPTSTLPKYISLDWWTDGECPVLPPGEYTMTTEWKIEAIMPFPKWVRANTPLFVVPDVGPEAMRDYQQQSLETTVEELKSIVEQQQAVIERLVTK